ncbi:MAG TPA: hypothetical protein VLX92_11650 [Kofleriaceae bacterium]|nr:hypothetical protein [Kofleriaceae bacterium]
MRCLLIVIVALVATAARADPADPIDEVTGAPPPGEESGRVDRVDPGDAAWRVAGRVALFVPKLLLEAAMAPVRGALWLDNRYGLEELYVRTLYSRDLSIGLIPAATYQTGFGATIGGKVFDDNLFGEHEHVTVQGTYGGPEISAISSWIGTGQRLGRIELGFGANIDHRAADPFYGIGNGNLGPRPEPAPLDPLRSDGAYETDLRYREDRLATSVDVDLVAKLHAIGQVELAEVELSGSSHGLPIADVYDTSRLAAFDHAIQHVYGELALRWDSRRSAPWEASAIASAGTLATAYAGPVRGLGGAADFWHYGGELAHYIRLGQGPRVLALRLRGEGVTGSLEQVPVSELPMLGGDLLRGYPFERFRDRVAAFGTAEYEWDLSRNLEAYLFVDAGRVFPALDQLTVDRMRAGYGVGCVISGDSAGFIVEGSLASSIDGGLIVTAAFTPVLREQPRWR